MQNKHSFYVVNYLFEISIYNDFISCLKHKLQRPLELHLRDLFLTIYCYFINFVKFNSFCKVFFFTKAVSNFKKEKMSKKFLFPFLLILVMIGTITIVLYFTMTGAEKVIENRYTIVQSKFVSFFFLCYTKNFFTICYKKQMKLLV